MRTAQYEPSHLDLRCLQKPFIIAYGSERVLLSVPQIALRKHANSNILKLLQPKQEKFQIKILIFSIFLLKTQIVGI